MARSTGTPVTIAIIGAGNRGAEYGHHLSRMPGSARVVAVADPDESRRRALR